MGDPLLLTVSSGSMEPLLLPGDRVLIQPAATVAVGEIAAFRSGSGIMIHRIVGCLKTGRSTHYLHAGDATGTPGLFRPDELLGVAAAAWHQDDSVDLSGSYRIRPGVRWVRMGWQLLAALSLGEVARRNAGRIWPWLRYRVG